MRLREALQEARRQGRREALRKACDVHILHRHCALFLARYAIRKSGAELSHHRPLQGLVPTIGQNETDARIDGWYRAVIVYWGYLRNISDAKEEYYDK
ncbi:MAG: hypothetical protein FWD43_04945 [Coriobacteriia bacterium]|nr:hypothetical protein [Coriobacteriia bacterium]